jgi:hypothetical protein
MSPRLDPPPGWRLPMPEPERRPADLVDFTDDTAQAIELPLVTRLLSVGDIARLLGALVRRPSRGARR